eukprot:GHVN01102949.1.p2 GENE.GHVN01102949.1~~GHVN01102949.1.p2  ORF type:complete len:195 (-),score=20.64 GHVN01102949.1:144-728(-)
MKSNLEQEKKEQKELKRIFVEEKEKEEHLAKEVENLRVRLGQGIYKEQFESDTDSSDAEISPPELFSSSAHAIFPFSHGLVTIHSCGYPRFVFNEIVPVGLSISRIFASLSRKNQAATYFCKVEQKEGRLVFSIRPDDIKATVYVGETPEEAYMQVLRLVKLLGNNTMNFKETSGRRFFCLKEPYISLIKRNMK